MKGAPQKISMVAGHLMQNWWSGKRIHKRGPQIGKKKKVHTDIQINKIIQRPKTLTKVAPKSSRYLNASQVTVKYISKLPNLKKIK